MLTQKLPYLAQQKEGGRLGRLEERLDDLGILGIPARSQAMSEGALMVAALNHDPPAASVHFRLSLLSLGADGLIRAAEDVREDELEALWPDVERLRTTRLTPLRGYGADHALVWEQGSLDLGLKEPASVFGEPYGTGLPEGDGEVMLRRFIEDSVDLLTDHEVNRRRLDEEREPLNLLWPWSLGMREPMPSLAIRRGAVARFASQRFQLAGYARLVGYRHHWVRQPAILRTPFTELAKIALSEPISVFVFDEVAQLRAQNRMEEAQWWLREWDTHFLGTLDASRSVDPHRFALVLGGEGSHLVLVNDPRRLAQNSLPCDERAMEERLETEETWQWFDSELGLR